MMILSGTARSRLMDARELHKVDHHLARCTRERGYGGHGSLLRRQLAKPSTWQAAWSVAVHDPEVVVFDI
jgi:hypothetical protein